MKPDEKVKSAGSHRAARYALAEYAEATILELLGVILLAGGLGTALGTWIGGTVGASMGACLSGAVLLAASVALQMGRPIE